MGFEIRRLGGSKKIFKKCKAVRSALKRFELLQRNRFKTLQTLLLLLLSLNPGWTLEFCRQMVIVWMSGSSTVVET
jgi:hypothetical protein